MHYSVTGRPDSKTCGQWLIAHMETSEEWCPSRLGTLTNTVQHLSNRGIKSTLSIFTDNIELWGTVTHAKRKGYHPERPRQAWEVGQWKPCEVQLKKKKCKVLYLGHRNPRKHLQRSDWGKLWRERLGGDGWWKIQHETALCAHSLESQSVLGCIQRSVASRLRWFFPSPLILWDPTSSIVSSSGVPNTSCWRKTRGE